MSFIEENKEKESLETFFNLLNTNPENFTPQESLNIISQINDAHISAGIDFLESNEKQIISKNNSIDEMNNNTSLLYNYIYSIFITILIVIILGIVTYLKNVLNMSESIYMTLVILIIVSYIFYIFYLFDIMYVQNSINKILTFFRTGQFEISAPTLGKLPHSVYVKELCKKKKALAQTNLQQVGEEDNSESSMLKKGTYKPTIPTKTNDALFYNDNNAPNLQYFPVVSTNKFSIINVDADSNIRSVRNTNRL
jgi:hypothetical protein